MAATFTLLNQHRCCRLLLSTLLLSVCRLKNGQPLKDDYRFRQKIDNLVIRGVAEMDAGIYTVVLTNKITKEEQRRSLQLLVNGTFSTVFFLKLKAKKVFSCRF